MQFLWRGIRAIIPPHQGGTVAVPTTSSNPRGRGRNMDLSNEGVNVGAITTSSNPRGRGRYDDDPRGSAYSGGRGRYDDPRSSAHSGGRRSSKSSWQELLLV